MIKLLELERKMIYAKVNKEKIKYWWYKRKYNKLKDKLNKQRFFKK